MAKRSSERLKTRGRAPTLGCSEFRATQKRSRNSRSFSEGAAGTGDAFFTDQPAIDEHAEATRLLQTLVDAPPQSTHNSPLEELAIVFMTRANNRFGDDLNIDDATRLLRDNHCNVDDALEAYGRHRERELAGDKRHIVDSGVKEVDSECVVARILTAVKQILGDQGARRRLYRDMTMATGIERVTDHMIDHNAQLQIHLAKEVLKHAISNAGWNMHTEFSKTTQLRAFNLITEVLKSEREERENSVKDDRIVNPALKRSVTPVLGGDNHIKSVLKEAPRQSQRLKPHKAATLRCSHPRATQKKSEIFRSSSVIAKGTGRVKTDGIGSSNGGVLESSINVSSAQSIPETGVSGAAGLQRGRLSPKSGTAERIREPRNLRTASRPIVKLISTHRADPAERARQVETEERARSCAFYSRGHVSPWPRNFSPLGDPAFIRTMTDLERKAFTNLIPIHALNAFTAACTDAALKEREQAEVRKHMSIGSTPPWHTRGPSTQRDRGRR